MRWGMGGKGAQSIYLSACLPACSGYNRQNNAVPKYNAGHRKTQIHMGLWDLREYTRRSERVKRFGSSTNLYRSWPWWLSSRHIIEGFLTETSCNTSWHVVKQDVSVSFYKIEESLYNCLSGPKIEPKPFNGLPSNLAGALLMSQMSH